MKSKDYEYLIERAHQCGRLGVVGANSDKYIRLEEAETQYRTEKENEKKGNPKQSSKSVEILALEYGIKLGEVSAHINIAIEEVLKNYKNELNNEQRDELKDCEIELIDPDINKINTVIDKVQNILIKLGLSPK